jgi:dihydrofolate synthase/folylpolyglutamate synthase
VLTSVGLDHTQWLGETEAEIAAEKLAVLRDHTVLIVGEVSEEIEALARSATEERHARFVGVRPVERSSSDVGDGLRVRPRYMERNFALACTAAEEFLGNSLDPDAVVAAEIEIPGRLEMVEGDPPVLLDAAHNPDGARALAEALPEVTGGRPVVAALAVLADKDARGIVEALAPACAAIVCTEIASEAMRGSGRPGAESLPAHELAALAREHGVAAVEEVTEPAAAIARGRELAAERGGVLLLAGSHYLLREWTARPAPSSSG